MSSQAQHRPESLSVFAVLHKPAWGLGAEEDAHTKDERWNKGGSELKTPGEATRVFDNDIGAEPQENTFRQQSAFDLFQSEKQQASYRQRPKVART